MQLSRRFGRIFGLLTGLALIAVAVVAIHGSQQSAQTPAAVHQQDTCTGDCANCAHSQTHACPPDAADGEETDTSAVDAEKCIGCVRCVNVAPEAFRMNPETRKAEVIDDASAESIARGAQACPVDAIVQ